MVEVKERTYDHIITFLLSAIAHVGGIVLILLFCDVKLKPKEELVMPSELLVVPVVQQPEPIVPEVQEPEPPKPEPPKPEPPKPEPPKPEPPKPEPPKPEPPKPEPPKPEPPKPEPPKPEPPKPKVKSIAERLKEAPIKNASPNVQKQAEQPPVKVVSQQELIKRLADAGKLPSTPKTNLTQPLRLAPKVQEESVNYAENVVKPGYYEAWETPRVGDRHPTPVVVELDVISDGRVVSAKITRRSNDALMNASVEKLIQTVRQFVPFAQAGIKSSSLHIIVTMEIVD